MKKKHPCGNDRFTIIRVGMDIKLVCKNCGREIMLGRTKAESAIKRILDSED